MIIECLMVVGLAGCGFSGEDPVALAPDETGQLVQVSEPSRPGGTAGSKVGADDSAADGSKTVPGTGDAGSAAPDKSATPDAGSTPVAGGSSSSGVVLTVEQMISDMNAPHEALAHGIPAAWSWGSRPRLGRGNSVPSDWTSPAFVPWGIAATAASGSPAKNVRVQIRKMTADIKRNGVWQRMTYASSNDTLMGAIYTNYETNANAPADVRAHGSDGISVKLPSNGGSFHFMTRNRFPISPSGIQGIVVKLEARLIVDDPSRPDDRDQARLLVLSGGDYWRSMSAQWNPAAYSNDDYAIGRFRLVKNDWQVITSHSLRTNQEIQEYIAAQASLSPM